MAFDIDRFRSEQVYRASAPRQAVLADLGVLRTLDAELERKHQAWSKRGRILGILGAVAFVGTFVPVVGLALLGLAVVLLGALLVCNRMAARYRRLDLQDRRYELVTRVLRRLRKDIAPDEPVTVEVDFHPLEDPRHLTGRGQAGPWNTESYVQRWLSLQVRLMDGTHLRLGMEERLLRRRRTKRNPRGKLKSKQKQKGLALLHVQLRVKPERHPHLARLDARARTAVRLPEEASLARLEVAADGLSLRARLPLDWVAQDEVKPLFCDAPRTAVMALLSLYQVLHYSTTLRKQEKAKAS